MVASSSPEFVAPEKKSQKIWRYMALEKFIALLSKRSLYFCRIDHLGDPHEGALTRTDEAFREASSKWLYANRDKFGINGRMETPEEARTRAKETSLFLRQVIFVNCWHMNDHESAAMWAIYGARGQSVAVTSTFDRLFNACPIEANVGVVRYSDFASDHTPSGLFQPMMQKRKAYEYEKEVRAVIFGPPHFSSANQFGIEAPVVLEDLIEEVVVSPQCSQLLVYVASELMVAFKVEKRIRRSSLDDEPLF